MSATTGPILAIGAITLTNESIVNGKPVDWKVPVATTIAAVMFSFLEKAVGPIATDVAWLALITTLFVRIQKDTPSPVEAFVKWYNG